MDLFSCGITAYLAAALLILFIVHLYRHFTRLRRCGFQGPTPLPLVGNFIEQFYRSINTCEDEWTKKYGRVFGYYDGYRLNVYVTDPEVLKTILIKEFPNFMDRPGSIMLPKLLQNTLFFMRGRKWKKTRNILTPAFSAGKLKLFIPIINRCADMLSRNIEKHVGEDVEIIKLFSHFTMDVIASTAFGIDVDSQNQPDDPFVTNIKPVFKFTVLQMLVMILTMSVPIFRTILSKFGFHMFPRQAISFYERTGQMLINERKKNKVNHIDFIQIMLEAEFDMSKSEHTQHGVSIGDMDNGTHREAVERLIDDEINGQVFGFFLGGYETTASTLRYAAYTLALHPDVDRKLYDEIVEVLGDKPATYDSIANLKYMDMFVSEVLRFYPPITRLNRAAKEDMQIGERMIPKGSVIAIPVWKIHHDPEYYPDPENFDPARFSADKKGTSSTEGITYLPFGSGPRHCIAMRMALVEVKIALVTVLRKVKFARCERTQVPLNLAVQFDLLKPKTPIVVCLAER